MSHRHHSFVSLLSQSPVLVLTVFVLLWLQTTVEAALLLDWVTGFQITVPTAVWYTSKSEFHSHFTVRDARALLITMNEECKPEWPSISENQMETGWAILKDTLVVVTFDDNEGHPLSSHCASHMDIIRNIIATKGNRRLEGILLPSQNPVPGGPNERYCTHWSDLPCHPPVSTRNNNNNASVALAIGFYSPLRKHQIEYVLADADTESIRATLHSEVGPWLETLQSKLVLGFTYGFIAMSGLFLLYGMYRIYALWMRNELNSTMANWIYALCIISLLLRDVGDVSLLSHTSRAILLGLSNALTAIAESALLVFWAKVMLRRKRLCRIGHYVAGLLGLLYGIITCVLHFAPVPAAWLVVAGWLSSGKWSISMLLIGAIIRMLFFGSFLFFGLLFYRQRQRVAITWTTRETTLRLTQLSAIQCATHLIISIMMIAGLALPDLRRTPECATPLHMLSLLIHIAQNASIILLLRPPVEETGNVATPTTTTRERMVSFGHTVSKHSSSYTPTPVTPHFFSKSDTYLPIRRDSALSFPM